MTCRRQAANACKGWSRTFVNWMNWCWSCCPIAACRIRRACRSRLKCRWMSLSTAFWAVSMKSWNRLYIQDSVYDAFAEKLKVAVAKLKIGNGLEEGTTTGPLIDEKAVAKVQEHIADAISKGATVLAGGKVMEGNFFEPTILVNVPKNAAVAKEETFGPLAPLFRFKDEAEVIAMSNDTEFGLASYFYARDLGRVFRVAEALEYGMVGVNTGLISNEVAPFGGIKASGLGREGSKYGIEDYLEIKYLSLGI